MRSPRRVEKKDHAASAGESGANLARIGQENREGEAMISSSSAPGHPRRPAIPSAKLQFARGIWRLAAANVTAGNQVRLLHDGPEAFDAMIEIIDGAQTEVALESYIVSDDAV